MNRNACSLFLTILSFLALTAMAGAQTTYEDPQGRFAIDIPKGWQLAPQTDDKVFVFVPAPLSLLGTPKVVGYTVSGHSTRSTSACASASAERAKCSSRMRRTAPQVPSSSRKRA